jgi:hypothetical protein
MTEHLVNFGKGLSLTSAEIKEQLIAELEREMHYQKTLVRLGETLGGML